MNATIYERGNGFPDVGDYVPGDDGELYRIAALGSRIETNQPGVGNCIPGCTVEQADWSDVESDDDAVHSCKAVVGDDDAEG